MGTQIRIRAYLKKANMYNHAKARRFQGKKAQKYGGISLKSLFSISKNAEHAADFGYFEAVFHRRT